MSDNKDEKIIIRGAREHNLKNVDVTLPRNKLVVISGLSGSGKSSLAFDTLFAEGQRRYMESLSSYARQFLGQMQLRLMKHCLLQLFYFVFYQRCSGKYMNLIPPLVCFHRELALANSFENLSWIKTSLLLFT